MPLIAVMMLDSHLWLLFPKSPSVLLSYQQCQWWPASFLFLNSTFQGTWSPLTATCPISSVAQGLFLLPLFLCFSVVPLSFEAVIT